MTFLFEFHVMMNHEGCIAERRERRRRPVRARVQTHRALLRYVSDHVCPGPSLSSVVNIHINVLQVGR